MSDSHPSGGRPDPVDSAHPSADEVLDRELGRVAEEWRRETRIVRAEQERLSEDWRHQTERRVEPFIWLAMPFRLLPCGCLSAFVVLSLVGLSINVAARLVRPRG